MPSFQGAEELRPSDAPGTNNDDAILNGRIPKDPEKLAVTSSLHPFWHTKKGSVVIGLIILAVVGAIVGGAVGGKKTASTRTSPQTTSDQASNGSTPSVTAFSTPSGIVGIANTILPVSSATTALPSVSSK